MKNTIFETSKVKIAAFRKYNRLYEKRFCFRVFLVENKGYTNKRAEEQVKTGNFIKVWNDVAVG